MCLKLQPITNNQYVFKTAPFVEHTFHSLLSAKSEQK